MWFLVFHSYVFSSYCTCNLYLCLYLTMIKAKISGLKGEKAISYPPIYSMWFLVFWTWMFLSFLHLTMRTIWSGGWKEERLFLTPGSLNVVSCVTNDLNVISCCETQRIQFSRLGAIFLPHHFLRVKQVCASANGFWIIEPRSDPTTKEKSYICHWI